MTSYIVGAIIVILYFFISTRSKTKMCKLERIVHSAVILLPLLLFISFDINNLLIYIVLGFLGMIFLTFQYTSESTRYYE